MDFLNNLNININYISKLPQEILNDYVKASYDIKIGKVKINKKSGLKEDINSIAIIDKINKKFTFESKKDDCHNFWKENLIKKIEDNTFMSENFKNKIIANLNYELKLQWYESNKVIGYYDIFFESLKDISNFIDRLEILIKITIFMFDKINLNKNINVVKAIFFLSDIKKKLDWNEEKTLGSNQVNSGLTSYKLTSNINCCLDNYIMIWRKEEMIKVYIHELIHYFKIDSKVKFDINFESEFCLLSDVKILPNEAYTDFLAIILNSIIYSLIHVKNLQIMLKNDIKFSLFQTAKILHYFKFKSWDDFKKKDCNFYLKQNSNVFPYFIIKSALLFNLDLTIKVFENITFKKTYNFNLNSSKDNLKILVDHIFFCLSDKKFIRNINYLLNIFDKVDFKKNKSFLNTLKMTILD